MSLYTPSTATPSFLATAKPKTLGIPQFAKTRDADNKIVVILDESGSMDSVREDIIKSLNKFIAEQQQVADKPDSTALFTLIKFNAMPTTVRLNVPFATVAPLSVADYHPNGGTALYDAIGATLEAYKGEKNVLVVIVTDGEENQSKAHKQSDVAAEIERLKGDTAAAWSFVYIGCDSITEKQGGRIGMLTSSNCTHMQSGGRANIANCIGSVSKGLYSQRVDTSSGSRGYGHMQATLNASPHAVSGTGSGTGSGSSSFVGISTTKCFKYPYDKNVYGAGL